MGAVILNVAVNHTLDTTYGWKAEKDGMAVLMETMHTRAPRFLCAALNGGTLNNCVMEAGQVTIDANIITGIKIGFFMGFFAGAAFPMVLWFMWEKTKNETKETKND